MRIVIITDAWEPQVNGVVRTYQNIIAELKTQGHEVKVIGPDDFVTFPLPFYPEIRLAILPYRKMAEMIEEFNPDGIHIPVEGPLGWSARKYCIKHKKQFTTAFHTHFPDYIAKRVPSFFSKIAKDVTIKIVRHFHAAAKTIYVATDSLEKQLRQWNFTNTMVRLVRGVDTNIFYPCKIANNNPKPVLIYVGRVAVEKNIESFLSMEIDAHKIVVGDGPSRRMFEKKYPRIEFKGVLTGQDLGDAYRRADCFVFPSKTDTFGMVLIEALACGLPVAGYDVTGPKDIITSDFLGAINDDLFTAVTCALKNKGTAQQRFDYVQTHYGWPSVAKVFLSQHEGK
jgi:glycosyltransferase involved in cell wall biosynthesis